MNLNRRIKKPDSPQEWMSYAKSDLRLALLAATDKYVRREQACFHAQQAAEKAIKAVLLSRKIEFPLTHDIEELIEITEAGGTTLPEFFQTAGILSPYAVETRYPGHWIEITDDDLQQALKLAEFAVTWADNLLSVTQCGGSQSFT